MLTPLGGQQPSEGYNYLQTKLNTNTGCWKIYLLFAWWDQKLLRNTNVSNCHKYCCKTQILLTFYSTTSLSLSLSLYNVQMNILFLQWIWWHSFNVLISDLLILGSMPGCVGSFNLKSLQIWTTSSIFFGFTRRPRSIIYYKLPAIPTKTSWPYNYNYTPP